ncbi:Short-chain dehydrogenase/reductase SDR [Penicillium cf. griseofulvum]|uniref:Short-chain dehydrogenase/reductase SDR n=1 Tax=Penicillium cf. griseofulvum TaxID=2972120 RepID=A0A9W9IXM5_9EURO|nr:Short-chain dehydrogenase/reductase SDR [Penicillium cf. griseofulvum]KAJ5436537.1 Short-chain dehydrogenase/reductase SDR [Penicillium cf. griseofulvum]
MSNNQQILRSEVVLEKYGKALAGKTVLITGVSDDSIAGELAVQLSTADPKLLILTARAESKVQGIQQKIKSAKPNVETRFLNMDLSDMTAIRNAVEDLADVSHIDHLVSVAGVMFPPYSRTNDGFESQLGVNYLANFLLVKLLLPKVRAAGPNSSVVLMASSMARQGKMLFDDFNFSDGRTYDAMVAYGQSNAARVMFVKRLGEKLKSEKIRVFSVDPGAVLTGLQRHCPPGFLDQVAEWTEAGTMVDLDGKPFDIPPWTSTSEGAATVITGMIDPTISGYNGSYLNKNAVSDHELHTHINDEENWTKLWDLSEDLTKEKFSL